DVSEIWIVDYRPLSDPEHLGEDEGGVFHHLQGLVHNYIVITAVAHLAQALVEVRLQDWNYLFDTDENHFLTYIYAAPRAAAFPEEKLEEGAITTPKVKDAGTGFNEAGNFLSRKGDSVPQEFCCHLSGLPVDFACLRKA